MELNKQLIYVMFMVFPFTTLASMYIVLMFINRKTTGEVKRILPPDILLKVMALFMLVCAIFILAMEKIVNESTVSALLGAIATGVLGVAFKNPDPVPPPKSVAENKTEQKS
ncbi:hypothetical protein [Pseudomonas xanthosomatis]|uniref:hypothetical protein n=1 Tax=Pseudomonas xanthosomatis TaxID=2842356 RepID=UPI0035158D9B